MKAKTINLLRKLTLAAICLMALLLVGIPSYIILTQLGIISTIIGYYLLILLIIFLISTGLALLCLFFIWLATAVFKFISGKSEA
ncbi:MAG: hypothetical protein WC460_04235 [Patescibacteria group bacterium]